MNGKHFRPDWHDQLRISVERSGRSHASIASDAGISRQTLARILREPHANARFETVLRIVTALGVRLGWLIGEPRGVQLTDDEVRMFENVIAILDKIAPPPK